MPQPQQNPVVRLTVDGAVYELDFSDLTAIDSKDFRREVGIPLSSVLSDKEDADLDVIAGLVWLARRKVETALTYVEVASKLTLLTPMDVESVQPAAEDGSSPEV